MQPTQSTEQGQAISEQKVRGDLVQALIGRAQVALAADQQQGHAHAQARQLSHPHVAHSPQARQPPCMHAAAAAPVQALLGHAG